MIERFTITMMVTAIDPDDYVVLIVECDVEAGEAPSWDSPGDPGSCDPQRAWLAIDRDRVDVLGLLDEAELDDLSERLAIALDELAEANRDDDGEDRAMSRQYREDI
jgi:hypothetical protein